MGKPIAFRRRIRHALKDTAGGVLVYFGIMLPILFGFVGLASDVAIWHMESRSVDTMTDSVAYSTALEVMRSTSALNAMEPDDRQAELLAAATVEAELNGFDAARGDTIEVYSPPRTGPRAGDWRAVEVVMSRRAPILFGALVGGGDAIITDRAVAVRGATNCVMSLNETDSGTIIATGTSKAQFPCGIHSNSDNTTAIKTEGFGAKITAPSIDVVGGYSGSGFTPAPSTGANVEEDPIAAGLPSLIPDYSTQCAVAILPISESTGSTYTIGPVLTPAGDPSCIPDGDNIVVIGSDLIIDSQSVVDFEPGIYVLTGDFIVSGGASLTGDEVTFIFQNGRIDFSGGKNSAGIRFSAPTTGPLAGFLFVQDPAYTGLLDPDFHDITGGTGMILDGIVYFPESTIQFSGGSSTEQTASMLIADKLAFTGNVYMASPMDGAAGTSAPLILGLQALLVE